MTPLALSTDDLRERTTDKGFGLARGLVADKKVVHLVRRGASLHGAVRGSDLHPYRVTVPLTESGVGTPSCSCPSTDKRNWCKHVVAVLLRAMNAPDAIEERPSLSDVIAAQSPEALHAALLGLAEAHPHLADEIEARVQGQDYKRPSWDFGFDGWKV